MPNLNRKYGNFVCDNPGCTESFVTSYRLDRHRLTHRKHEDREFGCSFEGCPFRSNQYQQLTSHLRRMHKKKRVCDYPGCYQTFSNKADCTNHKKLFHGASNAAACSSVRTASSSREPTEHPGVLNATDVQHDSMNRTQHPEGAQTAASPITPLLSSSTRRQDHSFDHSLPQQVIEPGTVPCRFRRKWYLMGTQSSLKQRG